MGRALQVDWSKLQLEYQKGLGNCRELASKYSIAEKTVQQRCWREKWTQESKTIGELVSKKVVEDLANEKIERIKEHEKKAFRVADKLISSVESNHDSMPDGLLDASMIATLASGLKMSVGVARQALGALDPGQKIDITSNGQELGHASALAMLQSCKLLHAQGKLDMAIDVEALVKEHAESKLEGNA